MLCHQWSVHSCHIPQRRHADQSGESDIEDALGSKATLLVKLTHRMAATVQKALSVPYPVRINQLLKVAPEVVVDRVGQVGRIRAGYYTCDVTYCILDIYMHFLMMKGTC